MHVVHIITRLIVGGAQENTILTCEGLADRGHRVTLISGPTRGPEGSLLPRVRARVRSGPPEAGGAEPAGAYELYEQPELVRAINPWLDLRATREIAAHLSDLRPDVVHTHSSKAGIVGRWAAAKARVPVIVHTIHGMSFNRTQPWAVRRLYAWLERRAARQTDHVVTVADAMIAQSVAAGVAARERFTTVYSGMEIERFTPGRYDRAAVRAAWGVPDDAIVVGAVARLFRRKGYEQLLPIMAAAAERDARLRFVWVGDGAQRADYEAELTRLGLRERTTLTGLVAPDEIPGLLAGFDVLAHASQWEGLPRAVVQGLLMQVPAVAFAIDGTPEVVLDGRTGRCVPLGDLDGFAAALVDLARDEALRRRMGAAGREWCRERFDARTMVTQLEQLYIRLLDQRRGPRRR